ncbi:MAG: hypothetical protein QNL79_01870, partial [Bacteroidia bacterium]
LDDESMDHLKDFKADNAVRAVGLIYTKFYAKESVIKKLEEMILSALPKYVSENQNLEIIELV